MPFLFPTLWRQLRFSLENYVTKDTWGWEIDERNLKIMNTTHFPPKSTENLEKNNSSVNIRFVTKTSDIRNFTQNIRSDVKS